jgi:hypothetical protein
VDPYSGRNYGYSIDPKVTVNLPDLLEFTGVVCYIGLERPFNISGKTTTPLVKMNWFLGLGAKAQKLDTLQQAEDILSYHHTCRLWKTHIAGQRHDYYFYSKFKSIEEFLDLLNVYMIMMS